MVIVCLPDGFKELATSYFGILVTPRVRTKAKSDFFIFFLTVRLDFLAYFNEDLHQTVMIFVDEGHSQGMIILFFKSRMERFRF